MMNSLIQSVKMSCDLWGAQEKEQPPQHRFLLAVGQGGEMVPRIPRQRRAVVVVGCVRALLYGSIPVVARPYNGALADQFAPDPVHLALDLDRPASVFCPQSAASWYWLLDCVCGKRNNSARAWTGAACPVPGRATAHGLEAIVSPCRESEYGLEESILRPIAG